MKVNQTNERKFILTSIILTLFLLMSINALAQTQEIEIPAPTDEEFQPADGIITKATQLPGSKAADFSLSDIIRIYNDDKTVWYEFNFDSNSSLNYYKNKKLELQTFAPTKKSWSFYIRLIAESKNWYRVVVNEDTKETKYTLKSDRILGRTTFEY